MGERPEEIRDEVHTLLIAALVRACKAVIQSSSASRRPLEQRTVKSILCVVSKRKRTRLWILNDVTHGGGKRSEASLVEYSADMLARDIEKREQAIENMPAERQQAERALLTKVKELLARMRTEETK